MNVVGITENVRIVNTIPVFKLEINAGFFTTRVLVDVAGDRDDVTCLKCLVEVNLDVTTVVTRFCTHFGLLAVEA